MQSAVRSARASALRLNAGYHNTNGDYTNPVTGGDLNAAKTYGGALGLQYQSEGFSAYARLSYSKERYRNALR